MGYLRSRYGIRDVGGDGFLLWIWSFNEDVPGCDVWMDGDRDSVSERDTGSCLEQVAAVWMGLA